MLSEFENNLRIPLEKPTTQQNNEIFEKLTTSNKADDIRNDANNCYIKKTVE